MGRLNVHKEPGWSQITKTNTGALQQNDPTRTGPVGQPHMARHDAPDQKMPQGIKWQTGFPNVHMALEQSQLRKTDTGTLE